MLGQTSTTNNRQGLTAKSTITGKQEFITSTGGVLNSGATLSGSSIPATGLTTAAAVQIVDGSGNQITSFGGGTQYTQGGTPPANPIGPTLQFNNAGTWATVGTANPLPVSATISTAGLATSTIQTNGTQLTGLVAGTAIVGKFGIDQTTPGTTNRVDIADSLNNPISAFPATFLRTTDEPHQVFYDPFDSTLDVTNRWTSTQGSSGVAASNTAGVMSLGTGTVANGYSKLTSQPSFTLPIPAWLGVSDAINIPDLAAPTANSYRFWGVGTTPTTPTAAAPLTDAVGFELSTAGKMFAVVWAGGTRTAIQDLSTSGNSTQPTDANSHRYICYIRTDKAYWYIDGITSSNLVATSNFQSPQVQTLPRLFLAVGGATPPASNSQIQSTGATAWDTGKNAVQLADGTFPWRKASISAAGAVSVSLTSTTITGTVAATQSGSWTDTVIQPTASLLNATVVGTGTFAVQAAQSGTWTNTVTQATGTNLHMVVDSGTITTVSAVTAITNALPAGTNLLGKVGIDQTTVGTTNGVSIAQIGATTVVNGGVAGTLAVGGVTANGAAKTGNPVRIGAVGHTANPAAVTDGQAVDLMADKLGKQVTVGSIRDLKANQVTTITASTAETTIVTSVTSVFVDMYGIIITNTSATAVNVAIKDATAGTTRFNFAVPAGDTRGFMLPEGGAIKQAAVTNNWTATVSASVTSVIITALTVQNL